MAMVEYQQLSAHAPSCEAQGCTDSCLSTLAISIGDDGSTFVLGPAAPSVWRSAPIPPCGSLELDCLMLPVLAGGTGIHKNYIQIACSTLHERCLSGL